MTPERECELTSSMAALLAGETPAPPADVGEAHAWRLVRWEADMPLTDQQRAALVGAVSTAMQPAGLAAARFDEDGDAMTILLALTNFPAKALREMVLWLCCHALTEQASVAMEQEGTMTIGEEFDDPFLWREHLLPAPEISDWWTAVSPMSGSQAHAHRTHLQTMIKRRQYTALGGYVTRALRGAQEPGRMCFAFVPLVIEAIWSQHAELSLRRLTEEMNLNDMARRPKDALMAWLNSLQPRLRQSPAPMNAAPIERVIAGIQADCSLPYSQQNLSRSLGLTPAYFCRLFHEKTGQHFSSFLTRTRMEKAQELLSDGQPHTLAEISESCGYPNKSYFCQVFKKYTGMTPGEFEQQRNQQHHE